MKRAYGKLELNVHELKCQKIYEKLESLRKAQAQKIRNGVKKSFKIRSEALSVIKQLVEEGFFNGVQGTGKDFLQDQQEEPLRKWFLGTLILSSPNVLRS